MNGVACEQKIGDILLASRIINENQLHQALKVQAQTGGRLGSILRDRGYVHMDDLLDYLGKQSGFPSMNLYNLEIEPSILNLLPFDKIKSYEVL
ncbi:MAG TPA: hypothetical protein VJ161_05225, partial [Geobacteraceae bacterium]|nr:hypothetical protein [Geobacteraceae bacterium]